MAIGSYQRAVNPVSRPPPSCRPGVMPRRGCRLRAARRPRWRCSAPAASATKNRPRR
jgi:hypothetical protein